MSIKDDDQLQTVLLQWQVYNELEGLDRKETKDLKHKGFRATRCQKGEQYFLIWQILLIKPRAAMQMATGRVFQS